MTITLHCGDYRETLADVTCDALICDPPYGARTHAKQEHGRHKNQSGGAWVTRRGLGYDGWSSNEVDTFVDFFAPRTRGWFCAMTSHDLVGAYESALTRHDRYTFAPLPCVQHGMNVRLAGDGPSNWCVWLVVSRP